MVRQLTEKQKAFCKNVASGMTYKDSYLSAYDANCNAQVAYNESSKLMLREDIQAEIKRISKPLEIAFQSSQISEREKQIAEIRERIEICKQKDDETSLIRYYDMLSKIYGLYKDNETPQQKESEVVNLDIDALKRLSGVS